MKDDNGVMVILKMRRSFSLITGPGDDTISEEGNSPGHSNFTFLQFRSHDITAGPSVTHQDDGFLFSTQVVQMISNMDVNVCS